MKSGTGPRGRDTNCGDLCVSVGLECAGGWEDSDDDCRAETGNRYVPSSGRFAMDGRAFVGPATHTTMLAAIHLHWTTLGRYCTERRDSSDMICQCKSPAVPPPPPPKIVSTFTTTPTVAARTTTTQRVCGPGERLEEMPANGCPTGFPHTHDGLVQWELADAVRLAKGSFCWATPNASASTSVAK